MSEVLRPADFRGLDAALTVELPGRGEAATITLAVDAVNDLPSHRYREEPFSLVLRGPRVPALPQGTYRVVHPRLGPVELFLVPIALDAQGMRYEATFN